MGENDLQERLIREESWENHLYKDSKGIWTIGVGFNIEEHGLPDDVIQLLLDRTCTSAANEAATLVSNWRRISQMRQSVLTAMVFQMGINRVRQFKNMLAAIEGFDFDAAADEMLDSKWAREDSPARAKRESDLMREG